MTADKNKYKVLLLSDAVSPHTSRWANGLSALGHKVYVLSMTPIGEQKYDSKVAVRSFNLTREPKLLEKIWFVIFANLLALIKGYQIVHSHYSLSYGYYGSFVLFARHIASVWGTDILIRPKRSAIARKRVARALNRSKAVCGTSQVLCNVAGEYTYNPIFRTPFGINMDEIDGAINREPFRKKKSDAEFVVGCVKWLKNIYGLDVLAEAVLNVRQQRPDIDIHVIVTGGGPDEEAIRAHYVDLIEEGRVTFTGHLNAVDALRVHNSLDVAVFPSRSESFGVSILEASAFSRPVIGSRVGGIPEVIEHGKTGYLVDINAADQIADFLVELHDDPQLRGSMGKAGREMVISQYIWDKSIEKMDHVYQAVMQKADLHGFLDSSAYFPEIQDFSIFYHPFAVGGLKRGTKPTGAREQRIKAMLGEMARRNLCLPVLGDEKSKIRSFGNIKYLSWLGAKIKYMYAEASTQPIYTPTDLRNRRLPDLALFKWIKQKGIPAGIFLRDLHEEYPFFHQLLGPKRFLGFKLRNRMSYAIYKKYFDVIFGPSYEFNKKIRRHFKSSRIEELAPGISKIHFDRLGLKSARETGPFRLVYAGGLGYIYDLRKLFAAVSLLDGKVHLTVLCRPNDLAAIRAQISEYVDSGNISFVHGDQSYLLDNAKVWDAGILTVRPHSYWEIALPVKLYDYVSINLPILASKDCQVGRVVENYNLGKTIDYNVDDLARELYNLSLKPDLLKQYLPSIETFAKRSLWSYRVDRVEETLNSEKA